MGIFCITIVFVWLGDEEALKVVLKTPQWQYLDTPIGRLARTLTMYSTASSASTAKQAVRPNNAPPAVMVAPAAAPAVVALSPAQHVEEADVLVATAAVPAEPAYAHEPAASEFDLT
ncbi:hypothetical protein H310_12873 [Aphanomyces invadans]|uniref:Uncharacterized protein n=1 Tax=Aphanomyces invadans TaxID=157072 RepID=A0A024TGE4_9STRA|nr:hypothetical protein H310_12873 [Aphanomyces invadans]ETV93074.1 hypothetical protein H310_12873 [Aphanomyces invadans]|eukprot:XP_008878339.1 hypothetical protein H310_12873 [Aphanomyces invadans]